MDRRDLMKVMGLAAIAPALAATDVLAQDGVTDLTRYAVKPGAPLLPDIFLD